MSSNKTFPPRPSHTSLGGYPVMYVSPDGVYCGDCAEPADDPVVLYEGHMTHCDDCHKAVASAYGVPAEASPEVHPTTEKGK